MTGQATDPDGKAIAGATVYLVSTNGIDAPLGTTKTDADGHYAFRDVALPVRRFREDVDRVGALQIYGTAPGFGFAWHGMRQYNLGFRPVDPLPETENTPVIYQGEMIVMDLAFRPAVALHGSVKDNNDKPIAGVKVELYSGDYLDLNGRESHKNFREFWSMSKLPYALWSAQTGQDGQFRIEGLPKDTFYYVSISHPGFATYSLYASNGDRPVILPIYQPNEPRDIVCNPLQVTLAMTRKVLANVTFGDTSKPAPRMQVYAGSAKSKPALSANGTTDADGNLTLELPPGKYSVTIDPPAGMDYVRTIAELAVGEAAGEQAVELKVDRACVVILEAVDAETGKGIRGVSFFQGDEDHRPNTVAHLQSRTNFIDNPTTDAQGRLRAVVYPGRRSFRIAEVLKSSGYRAQAEPQTVDLPAGETVTLKFELQKNR